MLRNQSATGGALDLTTPIEIADYFTLIADGLRLPSRTI
jgi:hypothetical protein